MAYNKQTWRNNELPVIGQTPINADRLNHMEQGILDAHTGNLTTQERNKLAGVEAGATVNSSDAKPSDTYGYSAHVERGCSGRCTVQ